MNISTKSEPKLASQFICWDFTIYIFLISSNLAPTNNQIPSENPCEKYTYAQYLPYATLVSFLVNVGVELFYLPCGNIFRWFLWKIIILWIRKIMSIGIFFTKVFTWYLVGSVLVVVPQTPPPTPKVSKSPKWLLDFHIELIMQFKNHISNLLLGGIFSKEWTS